MQMKLHSLDHINDIATIDMETAQASTQTGCNKGQPPQHHCSLALLAAVQPHRMTCCRSRAAPSAGGAGVSSSREYVSSVRAICDSAAAFSAASSAQRPLLAHAVACAMMFCAATP